MYLDERLYSTGNYYLDNVLDNCFYDGMNYAQKEFGFTVYDSKGNPTTMTSQQMMNSKLSDGSSFRGGFRAVKQGSIQDVKNWNPNTKVTRGENMHAAMTWGTGAIPYNKRNALGMANQSQVSVNDLVHNSLNTNMKTGGTYLRPGTSVNNRWRGTGVMKVAGKH